MAKDLDELLPKRVKIGYSWYDIEIQDEPWGDENNRDGEHSSSEKVIRICDSPSLPEVADTLTHELFHAIWIYMDLPQRVTEEKVATAISRGFTTVLLDNPGILQFYLEAMRG